MNPSAQSETKGRSRTHASSSGFSQLFSCQCSRFSSRCRMFHTNNHHAHIHSYSITHLYLFFDQRRRRRIPRPRVRNNLPFSVDFEIQVYDSTGSLIMRTHDNAHFGDVHLLWHNTIGNPFSAFRRSFWVRSPGVLFERKLNQIKFKSNTDPRPRRNKKSSKKSHRRRSKEADYPT